MEESDSEAESKLDSMEAALGGGAAAGLADTSGSGFVLVLGIADFFFLGAFLSVIGFVFFLSFLVIEPVASTLFASALAAAAACCLFSLRRDEERRGGFAVSRLDDATSLAWTDAVLLRFFEDGFGEGEGAIAMMRLIPMCNLVDNG